MIFQPASYCYFYPSILFNNGSQISSTQIEGKQSHYRNQVNENLGNSHKISQNSVNYNMMALSWSIQQNFIQTNQIIHMLDGLQKKFQTIENQYHPICYENLPLQKEISVRTYSQQSSFTQRTVAPQIKNNRTHPKIKLMEKIFGKNQYSYKLMNNGKFPKILFKQRNISLKIMLKNQSGETVINSNQISLNLKVFQNNGEEIILDSLPHSFMQGLCQTQIEKGVGNFSKIHPREVSRSFSGKGVCIVIYATSQQNQSGNQGQTVLASEIQPLIFYNIKVVVKQNKKIKKNSNWNRSEDDEKI